MRKTLGLLLIAALCLFAFVACSPEQKAEDGLALVSFSADERTERSLTRTNPQLDPEDFYWSYEAAKGDTTGLTTGVTKGKTAVKESGKGLATVGPFSYGKWSFTLYGYADEAKTKLAYQGTSELTINQKTNTLAVTVEALSSGANGYLQVPAKGAITLKLTDGTAISAYDTFVEKVYIKSTDTASTFTKTVYIESTDVTNIELASGSYAVTVSYQNKKDPETGDTDQTAPIVYAEDTIYVTIADYLTTKIGGDIKENNGSVEFIAQGEIIKAKTTENLSTTEATVFTVNAAPVISAAAEAVPETKVSIPADALTTTATSASVTVTAYSATSIAEGDASADFTIVNTEATKPVLGALDIKLYVDDSTEPTTSFAEGKVLTITTKIAKGLEQSKIQVKYNGTGADGTVTAYDAKTGELTFTVSHLSTYYVIAENACIYNASKDMAYESIDTAVDAASEGDTLILLDCSKSNDVSDEAADSYNWSVIHNNCASAADGYWHEKSDSFDGGYGTKVEPYMVATEEQFLNISEMYKEYAYYKISDDYSELDFSDWEYADITGSFDGNNKHFINVPSCLFRYVGYYSDETITLKNIEVTFDSSSYGIAYCIDNTGTTIFDNVKVHGSLEFYWNSGSFFSYGPEKSYTVNFVNSTSDATLNCLNSTVGGFIGHAYEGAENTFTLNIDENSKYTGTIYSKNGQGHKYVGMTSNGTFILNGTSVGCEGYDNVKTITEVNPALGDNGYVVDVDSNASRLVYSVDAQLDGYDSDNKTVTKNMNGITMILDMNEVLSPVSDTVLLGKVTSATIKNGAEDYGYSLNEGAMEVQVPGNNNYRSGTIRLTVTQYNSEGGIICTGTTDVIKIENPTT